MTQDPAVIIHRLLIKDAPQKCTFDPHERKDTKKGTSPISELLPPMIRGCRLSEINYTHILSHFSEFFLLKLLIL